MGWKTVETLSSAFVPDAVFTASFRSRVRFFELNAAFFFDRCTIFEIEDRQARAVNASCLT